MRVRITKLPTNKAAYGKQVDGALSLKPGAFGGADYNKSLERTTNEVKSTLGAVPRDKANLEAEGGETAFGPISGQSIPDHMKIVGKRHHEGGVPLNLPDDTFIFSDTAALKINDPSILAMFNRVPKKGGYTPAELAKPYDINKYKEILYDEDSSKLERNTATIMIKNFVMKLGALALVQESMKGFPQGIPEMARPYMEANGIKEEDLIPELKEQAEAMAQQMPQQQMPQEMMGEEMPTEEPMYPEQMPSGAPIASPDALAQMQGQGMPPEAMMQQPPMEQGGYIGIPYGAYGMSMGGYDMPFAQMGMQMGNSNMPFAQQNTSMRDPFSDVDSLPFYNEGGLIKAQKGLTVTPEMQKEIDTKWAGDTERYLAYKKLETTLRNSPTFKIKLHAKYKDSIEREDSYSGKRKSNWYGSLKDRTPDEVLDALLAQEERNRRLEAFGEKYGDYDAANTDQPANAPGGKKMINKQTADYINKHKEGLGDLDFSKGYLSQAAYIAYMDLMYEKNPEEQRKGADPKGVGDELAGYEGGKVSGIDNASTNTTLRQLIYAIPEDEPIPEEEEPVIPQTKEKLTCKCVDAETGKVTEYPVDKMEDCECQGQKKEIISNPIQAIPHWSVPAERNVLRNALMQVNPAATNVVLPGSTQVPGVYEEYQTKVDQALAGTNAARSAIMAGVSGAMGAKQAMLKDLLGQGINTAAAAVADVQSRNVDRQRETNAQTAQIEAGLTTAREQALQNALEAQRIRRDTRTANVNKRTFNTIGAMIEADKEMGMRQQMNVTTPQYMSEYDYGFITPTGALKPFTGESGATFEDRIQYYLAKTGDYNKAFDMAWKEARLNKKQGGFVLASNVFPFII
jgi:hypothetical protein